jgi:HJR/Mrr/RecB family endonuclease
MIFAVTKGIHWKYICDGNNVFTASMDVRYYSSPYDSGKDNRVSIVQMSSEELLELASRSEYKILMPTKFGGKLKNLSAPGIVGGGIGAVVLGPIGAAIGASLGAFIGSANNVKEEELTEVYHRCREKIQLWQEFDLKNIERENNEKRKYINNAASRWKKYHDMQSIDLIDNLTGFEFESILMNMYNNLGYSAKLTKGGSDWGVDIIAKKEGAIFAVQAKRYSGSVGTQAVQEVFSGTKFYNATSAVVITNSRFTDSAVHLAKKLGVTLIDRSGLLDMWLRAFPQKAHPHFCIEEYERIKHKIDYLLNTR